MTGFAESLDSLHHGSLASRRGSAETVIEEVTESERAVGRELDVSVRYRKQIGLRQRQLGRSVEQYPRHHLEIRDRAAHGADSCLDGFETGIALVNAPIGDASGGGLEGVAAREVSRNAHRAAADDAGRQASASLPKKALWSRNPDIHVATDPHYAAVAAEQPSFTARGSPRNAAHIVWVVGDAEKSGLAFERKHRLRHSRLDEGDATRL